MPATFVLAACSGQAATSAPTAPAAPATSAPSAVPTTAPTQIPPTQVAPTSAAYRQPTCPRRAADLVAAQALPATPACGDDDDDLTPAQTKGPYYTPNTPERASLIEPGITGTRLVVTGYVLTTGCKPVARALLDFWHADDQGQYDNAGYRLRGHSLRMTRAATRSRPSCRGCIPAARATFTSRFRRPTSRC